MSTQLNPYINFNGNARQAMEFYHSVFGGDLRISTFKEYNASPDPSKDNQIMHAQLAKDNGTILLMAADMAGGGQEYRPGTNFSVSLSGEDEAELTGYFQKLSEGGMVTMPLEKQVWGDAFGMCVDKFGVAWYININAPRA